MIRIFRTFIFIILIMVTANASGQEQNELIDPISEGDLNFFIEESYQGEHEYAAILYSIAEKNQKPEDVISEFASALNISGDKATLYIRLIIDSLKIQEFCDPDFRESEYPECTEDFENEFIENLKTIGPLDDTGKLLISVGENLQFWNKKSNFVSTVENHLLSKAIAFKDDLELFLEEASSDNSGEGKRDYESVLHAIVKKTQKPEEIFSEFSSALNISLETANKYARLIVSSVKIKEACDPDIWEPICTEIFEEEFLKGYKAVAHLDENGKLFLTLVKNMIYWPKRERFISLVEGHPKTKELQFKSDMEFFLEESFSKNAKWRSGSWEDILYSIVEKHDNPNEVISQYAEALGISEDKAGQFAQLIIDSVKIDEMCSQDSSEQNCDRVFEEKFLGRLDPIGFLDETGSLLASVGENLYHWKHMPDFINLVEAHPGMETILFEIFDYGLNFEYLVPLFKINGQKVDYIIKAFQAHDLKAAEELALGHLSIKASLEKNSNRQEVLVLTGLHISNLLEFGLSQQGVNIYLAMSEQDKTLFWQENLKPKDENLPKIRRTGKYYKGLGVNLVAALFENDHPQEARQLLTFLDEIDFKPEESVDRQRLGFLKEVANPTLINDDIFPLFVFDNINGKPFPKGEFYDEYSDMDGGIGWLWALKKGTSDFKYLGKKYLEAAGYYQMAAYIMKGNAYYKKDYGPDLLPQLINVFGASFEKSHKEFSTQLEKIIIAYKDSKHQILGYKNPVKLFRGPRPVYFSEKPLPEEFTPEKRTGGNKDNDWDFPEDLALPVNEHQIVRMEKYDDEWIAIYLSHALDPVGEVSRGGFWMVRSRNKGREWEAPLYLGLQQYFPYVVAPKSEMPLFDGETIRMEVAINELDKDSIFFPPVGLRAKRQQEGLYLEFLWEDLKKDTDQDGLTDIFEHRLGLNPDSPDSDQDGINDAVDGLPLLPFDPEKTQNNDVALAILEQIFGLEQNAIIAGISSESSTDMNLKGLGIATPRPSINPESTVFLSTDPTFFSGLDLGVRFIIYGSEELKEMGEQYGIFYPVSIRALFANKTQTVFYIIWDASWVGGEFVITKTDEGIEVDVKSSWIT